MAAPAPPTQIAAAGAAIATGEPAAAEAIAPTTNGGGAPTPPPKPPPVTPAARRAEPAPLPPRRPVPPTRRTAPPPPRRESNVRSVVITAIVGVLVLAGTAFGLTSLLGGDDPEQPPPPVATEPAGEGEATATAEPVTKENAQVMVFNGTSQAGLAGNFEGQLVTEGYPTDNVEPATLGEAEQRQTSVVMYRGGSARQVAQDVASALGIEQVERLDAATQTSLKSLPEAQQKDYNVVVHRRRRQEHAIARDGDDARGPDHVPDPGGRNVRRLLRRPAAQASHRSISVGRLTSDISPNGDGKRDGSNVSITIKTADEATVDIVNLDGDRVRRLGGEHPDGRRQPARPALGRRRRRRPAGPRRPLPRARHAA